MPLRKHYLLIEGGRRFLDRAAYDHLRHGYPMEFSSVVPPWTPNVRTLSLSKILPASWRRDMVDVVRRLSRMGFPLTLRTFHSRKHARRGKSKLHAVMNAPSSTRRVSAAAIRSAFIDPAAFDVEDFAMPSFQAPEPSPSAQRRLQTAADLAREIERVRVRQNQRRVSLAAGNALEP